MLNKMRRKCVVITSHKTHYSRHIMQNSIYYIILLISCYDICRALQGVVKLSYLTFGSFIIYENIDNRGHLNICVRETQEELHHKKRDDREMLKNRTEILVYSKVT